MKNIWKRWTNITKRVAKGLASIILIVVFVIFITPLSFVVKKFFKNALLGHTASSQKKTYWIKKQKIKHDLTFAKEQ